MGKLFKNGLSYEHTIKACFIGYIVQAIVNNFAPLLFLTFQQSYGIPLSRITLLITSRSTCSAPASSTASATARR